LTRLRASSVTLARPAPSEQCSARRIREGAANDGLVRPVRRRQFPVIGEGGGISSFIHLDDAAAATVLALDHDSAGLYNVVDDEPAPMSE
jgi:nucleoside-diphosphate-sugar epimerase